MKKTLLILAAAVIAGCSAEKKDVQLIPASSFETEVDGKPVSLYTLKNGDLVMQVTNFGGRVVSLWVPDREGNYEDVELGYDNIQSYVDNPGERFLGAVVGPYANRIAGGKFTLDGKEYDLPKNDHGQTLHGGMKGVDMVVWDVVSVTDSSIVLSYLHPDGQDGFPGNVEIDMIYTLTSDNEFKVEYSAVTDAPTYFNISHHSFFNLKGVGNGTVLDNVLVINASHTTPVDSHLIPTGEIADVTGTPFDFREPHAIGERIGADDVQLKNGNGYDHNWVLDRKSPGDIEFAASVYEPASGRFMEVFTDQPAMQFYSGNFMGGCAKGKNGVTHPDYSAFCLETQLYPNTPNIPEFPNCILKPGDTFESTTIYCFSVR